MEPITPQLICEAYNTAKKNCYFNTWACPWKALIRIIPSLQQTVTYPSLN